MRNKCESLETRRNFELAGDVVGNLSLKTGKLTTIIPGLTIRLGALELPLNYVHTDEGWKLSLEQRVYKQGRGYYYIDETGRKYQFEEEYFYQQ